MVHKTNGRRRRVTPRTRRRRQRGGVLPAAIAALGPIVGKAIAGGVASTVGSHLARKALSRKRRRRR